MIDLILEPASPRIEYWANFVCRFNASRGRHTEEELSHSQLLQKRIFKNIGFFSIFFFYIFLIISTDSLQIDFNLFRPGLS